MTGTEKKLRGELTPETPTEAQVADLLAQRKANKDISAALGINLNTVKQCVTRILERRGLTSRDQVTNAR